jgi:hypothetical protein
VIADVHGHAEPLRRLLGRLGYRPAGGSLRHPGGRKAVFLGDFVDRGPAVREVLRLAREMVEAGDALAIMGNHEYNAIAYHEPDSAGGYIRPRTGENEAQHAETLAAFAGRDAEWREYLEWFRSLPLYLDLGGLRVVHACWDGRAIAALESGARFEPAMLRSPGSPRSPIQRAPDILLKGPEIPLPDGKGYLRPDGKMQRDARAKWWAHPGEWRFADLTVQVPEGVLGGEVIPENHRTRVGGYAPEDPPVIFGHYGYRKPAEPLRPNVACIDLGVHRGGPLCAYRWSGEAELRAENFVVEGASARDLEAPADASEADR